MAKWSMRIPWRSTTQRDRLSPPALDHRSLLLAPRNPKSRTLAVLLVAAALGAACATSSPNPSPSEALTPSAGFPATPAALPAGGPSPAGTLSVATSSPGAFPDPSAYSWVQIIDGLTRPVDIQFPDDSSGRMFVLEQPGRIRIVEDGRLLSSPYLDIRDKVGSSGDEQGLLGLAFHPNFKDIPFFYLNYTDLDGNTVIARFKGNGDTADPASEKVILQVLQPFPNHNGGGMLFGPDGYLYLGLGDGGSSGDPYGNGQNKDVLLGKILRIDVDHGDPYGIPSGNPFAGGGGRPEIWAYGLRNPWRFSFAKVTNDLYIADVGQDMWEEVDVAPNNPGGVNYGWKYFEGSHPYASQAPPPGLNLTMPVTDYDHEYGRCAIIGGYAYAGQMSEWRGIYFYGDECSGDVWGLRNSSSPPSSAGWLSQILFRNRVGISTFGQDPSGEVYMAGLIGSIFRLQKLP